MGSETPGTDMENREENREENKLNTEKKRAETGEWRKRKRQTGAVAEYGVLIALAMVLGFVDSMIPVPVPVPGIKLGLANLVTLAGLYLVGIPGTVCVTVLRVILTGITFGNVFSMAYSLSGSFLSLLVMAAARKGRWFSQTGISILGGVFHNIGQLTFAAVIVRTAGVYVYLPALLAAGCAAGAAIGILGGILTERLENFAKNLE